MTAALLLSGPIPALAFDTDATFAKGTKIVTLEGGGGAQINIEGHGSQSDVELWNVGVRGSLLPFRIFGTGVLRGATELGVEPFYQGYVEPERAFLAGVKAVGRYHFLSLGRFVPYVELTAGAGGTDLRIAEIDSTFTFVLEAGVGASVFLTDRVALTGGFRLHHVSNGNTDSPNRGFEAATGVVGVSMFFR